VNEEPIITTDLDPIQEAFNKVAEQFREHATHAGIEEERIINEMRSTMENLTLQLEGAVRSGKTVILDYNYPTRPCKPSGLVVEHEHTGEVIIKISVRPGDWKRCMT
jgi:hypothetical protein